MFAGRFVGEEGARAFILVSNEGFSEDVLISLL
jgi:hypothetical protein